MPRHDIIQKCDEAVSAFTPEVAADEALQAMEFVATLKGIAKELGDKVEAAAIAWIEANGDLVKGEERYYVGPNKTTKCKSPRGTLEALLKATGGDFDAVVACLSAGAFKHGACREILAGDEYADLFETKETADLKTGKPGGKRLQKHDPRWIKGGAGGTPQRAPARADGPADETE